MKKREKNEKVDCCQFILALRMISCIFLKPGNKYVCGCMHCRGQAPNVEGIRHTSECCFQRRIN
jgi:hypothetical protein